MSGFHEDLQRLVDAHAAEIARLTREMEAARRERSAAKAEAMTAQASLRRAKRELEAAREREQRIIEVLERSACHDLTARDALDAVRRALATDMEGGEAEPPAHPVRMAQPGEEVAL